MAANDVRFFHFAVWRDLNFDTDVAGERELFG
jgi:hypothetical protein